MNDFYVVEFTIDCNSYRKGERLIVWKYSNTQYVKANSDMEYISSKYTKEVYKIKFEEVN